MIAVSEKNKTSYFLEEISVDGPVYAQVLCVHGLNQNPQSLKPLLEDLASKGIRGFLLHLPGHLSAEENHSYVDKQTVLSVYQEAYQSIKQSYDEPLNFIGYSFGGLIGTMMLEHCPYDKVSLLAPALKLRPYTHGVRPLLPYLSRIFSVPLGSEKHEKLYRFHHKGVPREVYKSFFDIYDEFSKKSFSKSLTKGIVFSHPKDELISYKGLQNWIAENTSWNFHSLSNRGADFGRYRHLVFDRTTLGPSSYTQLLDQLSAFFLEN